jgi:Tol biopolymer transport system component
MVALVSTGCAWIQRVSVDSTGKQNEYEPTLHGISANGRYVVFTSFADTLVPGDTNRATDVFVRDTLSNTTKRVSVTNEGAQLNRDSNNGAISADGRYIAFASQARNLPGAVNTDGQLYLRDTVAGTTTKLSVNSAGVEANGSASFPSLSADGRFVAYQSAASNVVAGDTNGVFDIFVLDRTSGTTTRISVAGAGTQATGASTRPVISADGHSVDDVFVRDLVAGTTTRANVSSAGVQADAGANVPQEVTISGDGRYVAFISSATNLVPNDTTPSSDVFVRDRVAGTTTAVSVDPAGVPGNNVLESPAISGDGRYVVFSSYATNLVSNDTNYQSDEFLRDRLTGTTTRVSVDTLGREADWESRHVVISGDGRYIAFATSATNLVPGDTNDVRPDIVIRAIPDPIVASVTPATIKRGVTTTVTIAGSSFVPDAHVFIDGAGSTITNVTVVSPTRITARVTFNGDAPLTARNLWVQVPGTGPGTTAGSYGVCAACVTVT